MTDEEVLQNTPHRQVVRLGDTVRRPTYPWTPAIHQLLRHLAAVGFAASPRVLGVDGEGREILSYLHGESGSASWAKVADEAGLAAMGRLLRDYHAAVADFRPDTNTCWGGSQGSVRPGELVCHGDFGPWNLVWDGARPVGILDWDYAWPNRPVHDVAYALEYVAPFRDDQDCLRWLGYSRPPNRRHRIEIFAEAYGLTSTEGLLDEVLAQQQQVLARAQLLAGQGIQPQLDLHASGQFDEVAGRIRWSREHRHLFA